MAWCDYCECSACKTGKWEEGLNIKHAKTEHGDNICDVCYLECGLAKDMLPKPKLVSEWTK